MKEPMTLRCMPKIMIGGGSMDFDLHILSQKAYPIDKFEAMCECLNGFYASTLTECSKFISEIESGARYSGITGDNYFGVEITKDGAKFFADHINDGAVPTATCSLAQLKVAVETYLQFLNDPERKPITVPFPNE